ncbi:MAG TPA: hypothetical protein VEI45_16500 [Mycobacterium sp.]|uniref:hypothetical protein n=1 Tax=Mycobacterium sp. TaxID=1785 RepID=UPI002D5B8514|nr:hypothetical protein [Mycobacterium sp.]HXY65905.1 hypothetical protein [Mycobacterium sp.]
MPMVAPQSPVGADLHQPDPDEPVEVSPVAFVEVELEKEVSMAVQAIRDAVEAAVPEIVKVRVLKPYRVVWEGKPYVGGDVVEIPSDTAKSWIGSKWVEPVPVSQKKEIA